MYMEILMIKQANIITLSKHQELKEIIKNVQLTTSAKEELTSKITH